MATPTIRQALRSPSGANNGGFSATTSVTTTIAPQVDDWIIAIHQTAFRDATQLTAAPNAVTGATAWVEIDFFEQAGNSPGVKIKAWRCRVTSAGNKTISRTTGSTTDTNVFAVFIVVGGDPTNPIDGTPNGGSGSTGTQAIGPVTTTASDSLLFSSWGAYNGGIDHTGVSGGATVTNGLLDYKGSTNNSFIATAQALTSAGAQSRTPTLSGGPTTGWAGILFAIKPAVQILDNTTGIPTGAAFGTATIVPQPVTLTGTGMPSASAFGTAVLAENLTVTAGIPTGEAFGLGNVVGALGPQSIPSALSFGTATLTPGSVTLTVTSGIPTAAAIGSPATLLGSVLAPAGIPSAFVSGPATVIPGPVTLTATGLPTSLAFGTANVVQPTTALTTEIVIRPRPRTSYEVVMVARLPQVFSPPVFIEMEALSWTQIKYGQKLSVPDTLDVTIKVASLTETVKQRLRAPSEVPTELWVYRNGKRVFAGPLIGGSMNGEELTLNANGILTYLQWMHVRQDMVFKAKDQFQIVKAIVDQWKGDTYGDFGIVTDEIGNSGVTLDVTYLKQELNQIYDRVQDLAKSADGFDISVDPVTRHLELWYPDRGVDRSQGSDAVIFDDRNVTDTNLAFSLGPKDLASVVGGAGTGSGPTGALTFWSAFQSNELLAKFGRVGYGATFRDVSSQQQNDDLTVALLFARSQTLWIPGPNVRVTTDSDLDFYDVGDTVSYHLHNELDIKGAFRMLARDINVDENSNESVSVSFV